MRFVENGGWKLHQSPEFRQRLDNLRASIRGRYAADLAQAGLLQRWLLHWRIAREFRRESRRLQPSPGSLYAC